MRALHDGFFFAAVPLLPVVPLRALAPMKAFVSLEYAWWTGLLAWACLPATWPFELSTDQICGGRYSSRVERGKICAV